MFLDTVVYKGTRFNKKVILDVKTTETFQHTFCPWSPTDLSKEFEESVSNFKRTLNGWWWTEATNTIWKKFAIRNKWSSRKPKSTLLKQNSQEEKEMLLFVTKYQPFFTKNNLRIQKVRVGVSLCVQLTTLHYFLWCPVINRETKFAFAIKALVILSVLYWQTKVK